MKVAGRESRSTLRRGRQGGGGTEERVEGEKESTNQFPLSSNPHNREVYILRHSSFTLRLFPKPTE